MSIETIKGAIESVGQHYLNGSRGVSYTLVRFKADDGRVLSKANVAADNELASYVNPGQHGVFAFHAYQKANVLCGYAGADRVVAEPNMGMAQVVALKRRLGWIMIFVGILGIPALGLGIIAIIFGVVQLAGFPKMVSPTSDTIEAALRAARR